MDLPLLEKFQQAYRDLDLFPLVEAKDIEKFRVDYGLDVLVCLKREIEASVKDDKFVFAGHRGRGKSTLLKRRRSKCKRTILWSDYLLKEII